MKKASIVMWNNVNILLCGMFGGLSIVQHDWLAVGGWMCAAFAWHHSNSLSRWVEECMDINEKAIALLEWLSMRCRHAEDKSVDDGEQSNTDGRCE